jgi:hypothetical protein
MFSVKRGLHYIQFTTYAFTEGNTYIKLEDITDAALLKVTVCVLCEVGTNIFHKQLRYTS